MVPKGATNAWRSEETVRKVFCILSEPCGSTQQKRAERPFFMCIEDYERMQNTLRTVSSLRQALVAPLGTITVSPART